MERGRSTRLARAIVVFQEDSNHPLRRILKPGFRHCAVAIESGNYWVVIDPRPAAPRINVVSDSKFDLAAFYRAAGYTAVETKVANTPFRSPLALTNCVGVVKALIGIRKPFVVTPYRLFRFLTRSP